jgi:hypothetical protein
VFTLMKIQSGANVLALDGKFPPAKGAWPAATKLMHIVEHTTQSDPHIIRVETLILT